MLLTVSPRTLRGRPRFLGESLEGGKKFPDPPRRWLIKPALFVGSLAHAQGCASLRQVGLAVVVPDQGAQLEGWLQDFSGKQIPQPQAML